MGRLGVRRDDPRRHAHTGDPVESTYGPSFVERRWALGHICKAKDAAKPAT
jgi:hypothetical protein